MSFRFYGRTIFLWVLYFLYAFCLLQSIHQPFDVANAKQIALHFITCVVIAFTVHGGYMVGAKRAYKANVYKKEMSSSMMIKKGQNHTLITPRTKIKNANH